MSCDFDHIPTQTLVNPLNGEMPYKEYLDCSNKKRFRNCREFIAGTCGNTISQSNNNKCYELLQKAHQSNSVNISTSDVTFDKFLNYTKCFSDVRRAMQGCVDGLQETCLSKSFVCYKTIRIRIDLVAQLISADPDLKVLYLMRDPRAIVYSRLKVFELRKTPFFFSGSKGDPILEAKYLCKKMLHDIKYSQELAKTESGSFKMFRYEDVIQDPELALNRVYGFLGLPTPGIVQDWIRNPWTFKEDKVKAFSTVRTNWTESLQRWRKDMDEAVVRNMTELCKEVLIMMNYDL